MEITETEKTIPVYTVGGRDFASKADAEAELARLMESTRYAYYLVRTGFDQAEGRGYFHERVVGIRRDQHGSHESGAILTYCLATFGKPIMEWYGRPVSVWQAGTAHIFDEPDAVAAWFRDAKAHAQQWRIRFDDLALCDGFGVPEATG
ncbi:MAG: hypothetical protein J0J04_08345 [Microbacterium sp.]|uniref:hypothetical protein n=1 Tax=Microbacterium sp. TaxID=51671 RepID=UPI001AC846E8|nr:hypothetical protein [Microbacterium sp.]MBN9214811.1 hypothetical protein [Microbacterium sp.]